jgi:hypothetical protein
MVAKTHLRTALAPEAESDERPTGPGQGIVRKEEIRKEEILLPA